MSSAHFGVRKRTARHDALHTLANVCQRTSMWVQFKFGGMTSQRRLPQHDDHYYRLLDIEVEPVSRERGGFKQGVRLYFTATQPGYTSKGRTYPEERIQFVIEGGKLFFRDESDARAELDLNLPRFARDSDDGMVLSALLAEVLYFLWEAERLIFSDKSIQKRRDAEKTKKTAAAAAKKAAEAAAAAAKKAAEAA
ncbi:MAG: hypothetical protein CMI52_00390, partial [Parcubacteria group bacterium]|nr:hypothetical protein [Parcubacteria group bacterium]